MKFQVGQRVVARLRGEKVLGVIKYVSVYDGCVDLSIRRDTGQTWSADPAREVVLVLLNKRAA
jgi:hypothetical protein